MHINNEYAHTHTLTCKFIKGCHDAALPLLKWRDQARACALRLHPIDGHVTSLGQQPFVTVLLIMLMQPPPLAVHTPPCAGAN